MDFETVKRNQDTRIVIVGVGGGGGNAVNRMVEDGVGGVEYITANTDNQALLSTLAENKIQLGEKLTKGLGAGAKPEVGRKAAEESYERMKEELQGADMIFVTAGMGGGTGTGAAPIIAKIAREVGALTVGMVTMPFKFEGPKKKKMAEEGLEELKKNLHSVIVIPNDKILEISPKGTSLVDAFKKGNEVLKKGVEGIVDIIKKEGIMNIDFADVQTVLKSDGPCQVCHMGFGTAKGESRALEAAKMAITSQLLETNINKAGKVLVNITSTMESALMDDLSLVGNFVNESIGKSAQDYLEDDDIIVGYACSDEMGDDMSVVIIATVDENNMSAIAQPRTISQKIEQTFSQPVSAKPIGDLFNTDNIQDIEEIKETKSSTSSSLDIPDFLKNFNKKK